ncbi:MAG: proline iminopeptidase-family hydrolase [Pseudomonadota bacterium]
MTTSEGFIDVTGGKVWHRLAGAGRPGAPLMVLHGRPGAPHDYLEPLEALADERPVVFYDQLGCGNSERPEDPGLWTVARFVAELDQVRARLGLDRVHLLGQSWGAMLAVEYLLAAGQGRVLSLILSAPYLSSPRWRADTRAMVAALPPAERAAIAACEASADYENPAYQAAVDVFYRRHLCRLDPWPECMERTFAKLGTPVYHQMWSPSEFTMTGSLAEADLTGRLGEIAVPALFICGEFDEAAPETTRLYASLTPGARAEVLAGAAHMHHLEEPGRFLALVAGFLRQAEAR